MIESSKRDMEIRKENGKVTRTIPMPVTKLNVSNKEGNQIVHV